MIKKNKLIECELRGPITWNNFVLLRNRVEKKWGYIDKTAELVAFAKGNRDFRLKINKYGIQLVLKYRAKKGEAKFERQITVEPKYLISLIDILSYIGETRWVLDYLDKFEAHKGKSSISFKFNSRMGDFFEIEELVSSKKEIAKAMHRIKETAAELGLELWDEKTFKKITEQSWKNVPIEPLVKNKSLHSLIAKALSANNFTLDEFSETIADCLKMKSNDYSDLENIFLKKTGANLLSNRPLNYSYTLSDKISIVIPSYNSTNSIKHTLNSIKYQKLTRKEWKLVEIIIVDDGSTDNTEDVVAQFINTLPIRYIYQNHLGRSHARNLGASLAKGDILIFIDSDMVLENHFIREHAIRHTYLDEAAFVSFKENIQSSDKRLSSRIFKPDITNDFRFGKEIKPQWLEMNRQVGNFEIRKIEILKETNNFKDFGFNKTLGVWDLPSMFVTNAVSIKRKDFRTIGGFNLQFREWGMEDTYLGACLIALGRFIIPIFSTGAFHIKHPFRSGSHKRQIENFHKNTLIYLNLIHQPISFIFKKVDS